MRLWPGLVLIALMWPVIRVPSLIVDHYGDPGWSIPVAMLQFYGMFMGPMVVAALFSIWWLFFSRIRWWDRVLVFLSCIAFATGSYFLCDPTFNVFSVIIMALPVVMTVWVGWLLVASFLSWPLRRAACWSCFSWHGARSLCCASMASPAA